MNAPEINVDINIEGNSWIEELPNIEEFTLNVCIEVIKYPEDEIPPESLEVSVLLCGDQQIRKLNNAFRGKDKATNVLSFPADGEFDEHHHSSHIAFMGDIAISFDTIKKEAAEQDKSFKDHYAHMLTHGMLHLLGFDHTQTDDAEIMEGLEVQILEKLGIKNPYKT